MSFNEIILCGDFVEVFKVFLYVEVRVIFVYNISCCEYCVDVLNDNWIIYFIESNGDLVSLVKIDCVVIVVVFGGGFGWVYIFIKFVYV